MYSEMVGFIKLEKMKQHQQQSTNDKPTQII